MKSKEKVNLSLTNSFNMYTLKNNKSVGSGFGSNNNVVGSHKAKSVEKEVSSKRTLCSSRSLEKLFKIEEKIGEGNFGSVILATHILTRQAVAIKVFQKTKMKRDHLQKRVQEEINSLRKLYHPNIMFLYTVHLSEDNDEIYIISEFCNEGDLLSFINYNGPFNQDLAAKFFYQLISAVDYLHSKDICHRDIKLENIMLHNYKKNFGNAGSLTNPNLDLKIIDFGFSKEAKDMVKTPCGSLHYSAPELISGADYYGCKVDIWACGIVLYSIVYGSLPFDDENSLELAKKIVGKQIRKDTSNFPVSEECKDLIDKCLEINPNLRPNAREILSHPFITRFKFTEIHSLDPKIQKVPIDHKLVSDIVQKYPNANKYSINKSVLNSEKNFDSCLYYLELTNKINTTKDLEYRSCSNFKSIDFMSWVLNASSFSNSANPVKPRNEKDSEFTLISNIYKKIKVKSQASACNVNLQDFSGTSIEKSKAPQSPENARIQKLIFCQKVDFELKMNNDQSSDAADLSEEAVKELGNLNEKKSEERELQSVSEVVENITKGNYYYSNKKVNVNANMPPQIKLQKGRDIGIKEYPKAKDFTQIVNAKNIENKAHKSANKTKLNRSNSVQAKKHTKESQFTQEMNNMYGSAKSMINSKST